MAGNAFCAYHQPQSACFHSRLVNQVTSKPAANRYSQYRRPLQKTKIEHPSANSPKQKALLSRADSSVPRLPQCQRSVRCENQEKKGGSDSVKGRGPGRERSRQGDAKGVQRSSGTAIVIFSQPKASASVNNADYALRCSRRGIASAISRNVQRPVLTWGVPLPGPAVRLSQRTVFGAFGASASGLSADAHVMQCTVLT
eukprot:3683328-Rhodomonas_salina.3